MTDSKLIKLTNLENLDDNDDDSILNELGQLHPINEEMTTENNSPAK